MSTEDRINQIHDELLGEDDSNTFYIPEKYQLGILTDYLDTHGFDYITEGRVFCYPIDILCVRDETTVAIEMKSEKISRGIEQAWRNSDFVDFSYLAVWEEQVTDSLVADLDDTPVGLLSISEGVKQISSPKMTGEQLCSHDMILSTIENHVRDDTTI